MIESRYKASGNTRRDGQSKTNDSKSQQMIACQELQLPPRIMYTRSRIGRLQFSKPYSLMHACWMVGSRGTSPRPRPNRLFSSPSPLSLPSALFSLSLSLYPPPFFLRSGSFKALIPPRLIKSPPFRALLFALSHPTFFDLIQSLNPGFRSSLRTPGFFHCQ